MPLNVRNWLRHEVDGGWAWIVCAASFVIQFIVFGTIQSYGIIFVALLDEFKSGEYETAWIGSLAYGLQFFMGPITATLCEHFGCRKMVFFGTGILMLALFASSFSPNLSTLYFTFGILWGIGASFAYFPCILVLRFYFSERISLANGISMSGAGIGTIVINVALNRVIQDYGWRVGLRMLGGIAVLMFACGSVYLPPPIDFYAIREWTNYKKVKFTAKLSRIFDVRPWKQKAFVVYVFGISLVLFGYFVPYVHMIRFGETLGVPSSQGALLVGYMSISQIFAKLCCGRLADMKRVKRLFIIELSILGFAICNMAVTAAKGYNALLAYAVFFGFFDGLFVVVLPILICDIVGRDLVATAIGGFYGVVATPMMLGPPISGQLYDAFHTYDAAFFGASFLMIIGGAMMYVVYRLKPELVKTELQFPAELDAEDMFSSNLFSCPSIHSHTVDALSGMFLTERYSMVNLDRPSQITFNPLHNLSYGTKSRAASSASRQTYFPSSDTDDRSEGQSEIFLQRLRGFSTATATGSRLYENEQNVSASVATPDQVSIHSKDVTMVPQSIGDGFSTSTPKELSLDDMFVREISEAASVGSSNLPQSIGAPEVKNEVEITGQGVVTGEHSYVNEISTLEDTTSIATLVNLDFHSGSQNNDEVSNTVTEDEVIAESEIAFLEPDKLTNTNQMKDSEDLSTIGFQPCANQLQVPMEDPCADGVDNVAVGHNQGVLKVEGLQHALPVIPEGIELADPVNLQNEEVYNKESLLTDFSASTETPSTDLETTDGDPTVRTATLVEIDDTPLSDKLDDSDTLVPEDSDVSSETVKYEGSEPEFEQNIAENYEEDALIKLPPPPNVVRKDQEMITSPLVDLKEDEESTDAQEPDFQNILVNILEDVNDIGQEAENIRSSIYTDNEENKIRVSLHPVVQEELMSPMFDQGHTGELTSPNFSGAQDTLIKLPPPPNVVRKNQEIITSPLVDLKEDEESIDAQEPNDQNILVNILEDVNDTGQEAENIWSSMYTDNEENKIRVSPRPVVQEELMSPMFDQGHTGELMSANFSGAQDFHTPVTTKMVNSTHFDLLNRRLEAVAAEQMKGELINRFPTDEMTLFAASRSMAPTPFESQGTPVCHNVPCSSRQSKHPSAQRTPGDIVCSAAAANTFLDLQSDGTSMRTTGPITVNTAIQDLITSNSPETWQQSSHTPEVTDNFDSQFYADCQENKDLESYQENDIIKIPPPPDFERRRPSVLETQEPIVQFQRQDLESDIVKNCFEMEDKQSRSLDLENSKEDTCSNCNQDPGSAQLLFCSSDVEKECEEDMTNNASSLVHREDMISPVFVESYADQTSADIESAQEFHTPASNRDVDSIHLNLLSERLEDVANKQLQGELTMRFLTDEMTLFAASRSMNLTPFDNQGSPNTESDAPTSIQPVTTTSIINKTNPIEMATQDDGSPSSNAASEVISGISEYPLLNSSWSPANYESSCVLDKERPSMPFNPFISPAVQVSSYSKNDKIDLVPAQHPEETHPINIPMKPERKRSSRKSLTIEDSLECSLSGGSNSMVNVFEIELDEDGLKDRGSLAGNLAQTTNNQVIQFESVNAGSSTNPFIVETQECFSLDENIQTNDFEKLERPIVNEIHSASKPDAESTSDTMDHYYQDQNYTHGAIHDISPRALPAEKEIDGIPSLKKIRSTSNLETKNQDKDVCGEESNKETSNYSWTTSCNEPQECISIITTKDDDYSKGSEFEALDKEISNQLALIKDNLDCYPEDVLVASCIDGEESDALHAGKTSTVEIT